VIVERDLNVDGLEKVADEIAQITERAERKHLGQSNVFKVHLRDLFERSEDEIHVLEESGSGWTLFFDLKVDISPLQVVIVGHQPCLTRKTEKKSSESEFHVNWLVD